MGGHLSSADKQEVAVSVTQEKWDRAQAYLYEIQTILDHDNVFDFKTLEKQRGLLVYVTRTYPLPWFLSSKASISWWTVGVPIAILTDGA
ncbi:MAG: hypothetical protein ACK53Y_09005, partial [bacterium]